MGRHRIASRRRNRAVARISLAALLCAAPTHGGAAGQSTGAAATTSDGATILRTNRILDGTGDVLTDRDIVVRDGRIARIVAQGNARGDRVYDLGAATVLPGYIDTHVHVSHHFDESGKLHPPGDNDAIGHVTLHGAENAYRTLMSGVTTIQSLGGPEDRDLKAWIERGDIPGPRLLSSLGYVHEDTGTPEQIRAYVRDRAAAGADVIKVFASTSIRFGGVTTLSAAQLDAACGEARAQGLRSVVHAHRGDAVRMAAHAGCTQIEHGWLLEPADLAVIADAGMFYGNQIDLLYRNYRTHGERYAGVASYTMEGFANLHAAQPGALDVFTASLDTPGLKIVFSTDANAGSHGQNLDELIAYVQQGGQAPMDAVISATSLAAESLGMQDRIGSIARGLEADIIAVDGDPLADPTALGRVVFVMKAGRVYKNDAPATPAAGQTYDVLIQGGTVVDGTGSPRYEADVAVADGRIAAVSREGIDPALARSVIDATGRVVTPGFIDNHAHVQLSIAEYPIAENFLRQGITTLIASLHSGSQPWPLDEFASGLETAPNIGFFAGHTWTRRQVLGMEDRAPTPAELEEMKSLVDRSMRQGALGLSTGLLESVAEVIRIAREANIPAQINHHKAAGAAQWGWSERTLEMIDSANAAGLMVTHDLYPYTASSMGSSIIFPPWALAGGSEAFARRVSEPDTRARLEEDMRFILTTDLVGSDMSGVQFRELYSDSSYNGRPLADLAADRGLPNDLETGIDLLIELQLKGGFSAIYHAMDEADVVRIMQHPLAMIESDGDSVGYGVGYPHPRSYGAFPRVLARYVRDLGVLTLEEAIAKMTSMPARWLGRDDMGVLAEGMRADVAVFDPDLIQDRATYADPHQYSVGITDLLVNGVPVISSGGLTGERPGRWLRGPVRKPSG